MPVSSLMHAICLPLQGVQIPSFNTGSAQSPLANLHSPVVRTGSFHMVGWCLLGAAFLHFPITTIPAMFCHVSAWLLLLVVVQRHGAALNVMQNLHGMPGLLGGFIAGVAAFGQAAGVAPHGSAQLGFQILSLLCTVAIASTGGALVCALATGGCCTKCVPTAVVPVCATSVGTCAGCAGWHE